MGTIRIVHASNVLDFHTFDNTTVQSEQLQCHNTLDVRQLYNVDHRNKLKSERLKRNN